MELAEARLEESLHPANGVTRMSTLSVSLSQFTFYDPSLVRSILRRPRSRFIFLQALVNIILSYELLFGQNAMLAPVTSEILALGLWVLTLPMLLLPTRLFAESWFATGLLLSDTVLATVAIYLPGHASSHLYLTFFLLILVAASVRTLTRMLSLSLVLCAGYGLLLYQGILVEETVSPGHFLGIPVLLIMAVFYGLTLETAAAERSQRISLAERVHALRYEEAELRQARDRLRQQVADIKGELGQMSQAVAAGRRREEKLERRLERAKKMEAVARLAGVVAQDFNVLLRSIGIQTGEVLKKVGQDEPVRRHAERILAAGDRAAVLTGHLQRFSEQDSFQPEAVLLNATLQEMERLLLGLLPKQVDLRLQLDPSAPPVKADRGQLELVVMNLVVNARDAMPQGGWVTIETKHVGAIKTLDPPSDRPEQDYVLLAVTDTGCGMTAEIEARLFEPFFTTKEHRGGCGLATVYGIVRRCQGLIEVKTQPGRGTICEVYLPAVTKSMKVVTLRERQRREARNQTVLLVDDDEISRKLNAAALQRLDYDVLEARTAVEALLVAQRYTGSIHVVVSHAIMHDISGRELTDRLLLQHPGMKVIYMGGYADDVFPGAVGEGTGFLQKPFNQRDLVRKVAEVLP